MHIKEIINIMTLRLSSFTVALFLLLPSSMSAGTTSPSNPREVVILHMADTHAALDVHPEIFFDEKGEATFRPAGGFPLLAAAIEKERAAHRGKTMLINVGDTIHGSAVAEWTQGVAIVPIVNALGIDAFIPGNREFAYGPETFRKRMSELNHPVLAINLFDRPTGKRMFAPSIVKTVNGVRVGVVGITSLIVDKSMAPDYSRGLAFTALEDVQEEVDRLRAGGVEIVLLATELGLAQETQLARSIRNVDFILGGHTHERTRKPIVEGGVPVIEAGSEGSFLARLKFTVRDGRVQKYEHELLEVTPERYKPNRRVQNLVDRSRAPFAARLDKVVGTTKVDLYRKGVLESTVDNLLADAVREASGADIGISNGFRFSYPVPAGKVTEEDLYNIFPMDAQIKTGTLTGRQLREFWEQSLEEVFARDAFGQRGGWGPRVSGMEVRIRLGAPRGQRVVWMKVHGKDVTDESRYTVASCDRPGDSPEMLCRFTGASDTKVLDVSIQQAMRAYFAHHREVSPTEGRVTAEDVSGKVWSQYELAKAAGK